MGRVLIVAPLVLDDVNTPAGSYRGELGGSATYAALAARHFAPTGIAALIGDDFPRGYGDRLARVDLSRVDRVAGRSFRWVAEQRADGTTATIVNDPGATGGRLPRLGDLTDAYVLVGALEPVLQERIGPRGPHARSARFVAIDTMPCYIDDDAPRLRRAIAGADCACLTMEEADRLVGVEPGTGARPRPAELRERLGCRILVLKAGPLGATVATAARTTRIAAYPTTVIDPTGAGDAFAGAFLATLAEYEAEDDRTIARAALRGAAAASLAVEDLGPRALERATRGEIERRAAALDTAAALV